MRTIALFAAAVYTYGQPPTPVCLHQLSPMANLLSVPDVPESCLSTNTPPHTLFSGMPGSQGYQGIVFPYSGTNQNCSIPPLTADAFALTGECGGADSGGQAVACWPTVFEDVGSQQAASVTGMITFQLYAETEDEPSKPDVGPFLCKTNGQVVAVTSALSASNCPCPCPPSPTPTLTLNPTPLYYDQPSLRTATISPPNGWIYVPGKSAYSASNVSVSVYNPPTGSPNQPTVTAEGWPGPFLTSSNLVFTASSNTYVTAPQCSAGPTGVGITCTGNPSGPCSGGGSWACGPNGWYCEPPPEQGSPILIDTKGEGFHLTGTAGGVSFPFFPNKAAVQISWTDPNYSNGWLALDRNGNGKIDNATELFGNLTAQPPSATPNGYLALAVFDDPANGGNGNGVIDPGDQIFDKLLVWIDSNHDGISQPDELHSLRDVGVYEIGLKYRNEPYVDQFGDKFRYQGQIFDSAGLGHYRTYDVFLPYTSK